MYVLDSPAEMMPRLPKTLVLHVEKAYRLQLHIPRRLDVMLSC